MKVWTIQDREILEILKDKGVYTAILDKSPLVEFFNYSYQWMNKRMGIENSTSCVWVWSKWEGSNSVKDYLDYEVDNVEENKIEFDQICLILEIPDSEVLLSDFQSWHYVLMDEGIDNVEQNLSVEESWEDIFDVSQSLCVQGCVKELRKEWILDIIYPSGNK